MSYLNPLRLHFSGQFQASVSTVNNDPVHYDNARFLPNYQDLSSGPDPSQWNGWFNPRGDAAWRLLGCSVTAAWVGPGAQAAADDPIRTALVMDSDRSAPAKLVDLDPEQQLVSTIFGLEVRIVTADGATTLLRGRFEPAPFTDIWSRAEGGGDDIAAGAAYQSVLSDLEWGDVASSPFLTKLRDAAADGFLSIKFNVDSFNLNFTSPDFMRGRIVGSIGPATAHEPHHFVLGRHLMTTSQPTQGFFIPKGNINFCVARVDREAKKLYVDLGNALPTASTGALADIGILTVAISLPSQGAGPRLVRVDTVPNPTYTDPGWYRTTAGVVELPAARELTAAELGAMAQNPLAIATTDASGRTAIAIAEPPDGLYVRADRFVLRMSPDETEDVRLYATRFGTRYGGARVIALFEPSQLQSQAGSPLGPAPDVATPVGAIDFPARVTANDHGVAVLPIRAADPGNPRGYIDGQVYGIRPVLEETIFSPDAPYPFNPSDFISVLVWDGFHATEDPVTWFGSLQPILQQFENLYPVMKRFVRLGDYESVCENRDMLLLAFQLDVGNANFMPVTRELSTAKRSTIVRWLKATGPDGKPLRGTPPAPPPPVAHAEPAALDVAEGFQAPKAGPAQGGKAAALRRRIGANRAGALGPGTIVGSFE